MRLLQRQRSKGRLDAKQGTGSVLLMIKLCVLAMTEESVKEQVPLISLVFKSFDGV